MTRLQAAVTSLCAEIDTALRAREAGGQRVPYRGDFANLNPSMQRALGKWRYVLRAAMGEEPAAPPKREEPAAPDCARCNDTRKVWREDLEREVWCTYCPRPCTRCDAGGGHPYCATTPCACACHGTGRQA
jgi:hypothetical protein